MTQTLDYPAATSSMMFSKFVGLLVFICFWNNTTTACILPRYFYLPKIIPPVSDLSLSRAQPLGCGSICAECWQVDKPIMDQSDGLLNGSLTGKKGRLAVWKQHLAQDVDESWGDLVLIALCFISGMIDAAVFNVWSCFVSMQTGRLVQMK
jgi:hypothetical protein